MNLRRSSLYTNLPQLITRAEPALGDVEEAAAGAVAELASVGLFKQKSSSSESEP